MNIHIHPSHEGIRWTTWDRTTQELQDELAGLKKRKIEEDKVLLDRLFKAETEVKQYKQAMGQQAWQPIDTAPKDGTEVLIYAKGIIAMGGYSHMGKSSPVYDVLGGHRLIPTHWMPLPEAPEEVNVALFFRKVKNDEI